MGKVKENETNQHKITTNGTFSDNKRFVQALCDSMAVVTIVLALVICHMCLIFSGIENKPFEIFATIFFIGEVSIRLWAHTPYYFFLGYNESCADMSRWINCIDFSLSLMDIVGIILEYAFAGNEDVSAGAKSARITRVVRAFKLVRTLRMWRIVKMFFLVFAQERDSEVMNRRKRMVTHRLEDWRIDRADFDLEKMDPDLICGLDLSNKGDKHRLDSSVVKQIRKDMDLQMLRKFKLVADGAGGTQRMHTQQHAEHHKLTSPDTFYNRHILQPTHSTTDTFYNRHILQPTHPTTDKFYNRHILQPTHSTTDTFYNRHIHDSLISNSCR
jgi:hypothetical protein